MTATPEAIRAGDLAAIDGDLLQATNEVRAIWRCPDDADPLVNVARGMEAIIRADSGLRRLVQQQAQLIAEYRQQMCVLRGRINAGEWGA